MMLLNIDQESIAFLVLSGNQVRVWCKGSSSLMLKLVWGHSDLLFLANSEAVFADPLDYEANHCNNVTDLGQPDRRLIQLMKLPGSHSSATMHLPLE